MEQEGLLAVRLVPDLRARGPRRKDLLKVETFWRDLIAVARLGCITGTKVAKSSGISSEPGRSESVEPMLATVSSLGNVLGERRPSRDLPWV